MLDPIERVRLDWVRVQPSAIHGLGLFAQTAIRPSSYIGDYAGPVVDTDDRYVLWVEGDDDEWIGVNGSNALRYLNHSTAPNAELHGVELYALTHIAAGQEITIHYGEDWEEPPSNSVVAAQERGERPESAGLPAAALSAKSAAQLSTQFGESQGLNDDATRPG